MSNEAAVANQGETEIAVVRLRRAALRIAFGVTACFTLVELFEWDATFVAPLLAASMLVKPQPPSFKQGLLAIVVIALSTLTVLVITAALLSNAAALIIALLLLIYISFYAHRRGAPDLPTLLLQISAVALPTIAVASPGGAGAFAGVLLLGGVIAILSVWAAHWAFPAPAEPATADLSPAASATPPIDPHVAARHALLDTLVLFPVLIWFILDATQVAVVVLITIVMLLRQIKPEQGQRAALGMILGNFIGGIAAAIAFNILELSNTLLSFVIICLTVSLVFAGRIVTAGDRAPIYAIAFSTFILLLGLGISPLPGGSGEAFVSRLLNVLLASAYAIGALSLVARWRPQSFS